MDAMICQILFPLASSHFYYPNYLRMTFFSVSADLLVRLQDKKMREEGKMGLQEYFFMMSWGSQMFLQFRILIVLLETAFITTISLHMRS